VLPARRSFFVTVALKGDIFKEEFEEKKTILVR
jgi:hypothetical protein